MIPGRQYNADYQCNDVLPTGQGHSEPTGQAIEKRRFQSQGPEEEKIKSHDYPQQLGKDQFVDFNVADNQVMKVGFFLQVVFLKETGRSEIEYPLPPADFLSCYKEKEKRQEGP